MFSVPSTTIAAALLFAIAVIAARRRDATFLLDAAFVASTLSLNSKTNFGVRSESLLSNHFGD